MPSNYSGNPNNITTPLSASIVSCSSGSGGLVLVQTSGAHNFATYDYVSITGVTGTTEANVTDQITVVDASSFLLNSIPFVNPYSSGGTAEDISLTPYFSVPNDGEQGTVAQILASIQAIADRTQFLKVALRGALKVALYTADDSFQGGYSAAPALVIGCGGGGGGGGGCLGNGIDGSRRGGGAGGGGAILGFAFVTIAANTTYAVTIGTGGAGGDGAVALTGGTSGGDGTDSSLGSLATFRGAQGGYKADQLVDNEISGPGNPARDNFRDDTAATIFSIPGLGGYGYRDDAVTDARRNGQSTSLAVGGTQGATGADVAGGEGGTGGGGGGAGGFIGSTGGDGGDGGDGDAATGVAGSVGAPGLLGGGGGGGGAGGGVNGGTPGNGGNGGAGGDGFIAVIYLG